jgi:hypothetical protein
MHDSHMACKCPIHSICRSTTEELRNEKKSSGVNEPLKCVGAEFGRPSVKASRKMGGKLPSPLFFCFFLLRWLWRWLCCSDLFPSETSKREKKKRPKRVLYPPSFPPSLLIPVRKEEGGFYLPFCSLCLQEHNPEFSERNHFWHSLPLPSLILLFSPFQFCLFRFFLLLIR